MIMSVTKKLLDKLRRKPYREAYVEENVRTGIAYQIRALREARGWSQKKLAEVLGKPQSVLSRIEDPDYGKLSLQTLLEVAAAFDVALLVQFADFPEFIQRMANVSPEALDKQSFGKSQFVTIEGNNFIFNVSGAPAVHGAVVLSSGSIIHTETISSTNATVTYSNISGPTIAPTPWAPVPGRVENPSTKIYH